MNTRLPKIAAWQLSLIILFYAGALQAQVSQGFLMLSDEPAEPALAFQNKFRGWFHSVTGLFDGRIRTRSSEPQTLDRRLMEEMVTGVEMPFASSLSLRLMMGVLIYRRELEEWQKPPKSLSSYFGGSDHPTSRMEEDMLQIAPAADFTLTTPTGLELFAGAKAHYLAKVEQDYESSSSDAQTTLSAINLTTPRVGLAKHSGDVGGGVYYSLPGSSKRQVEKTASDGSVISTEQEVFVPPVLGLFGGARIASYQVDGQVQIIQGSSASEKSPDGTRVSDDYLRLIFGWAFEAGSGQLLKLKVGYQTIGYRDNAFMNFENTPKTAFECRWLTGDNANHTFVGLLYEFSGDEQSLPEVNAHYEAHTLGVALGLTSQL